MVTLTIDGQTATVPKGTNLIEAARSVGIDIPYLCYHHQLTAFGGCRLCLVEVEKVPKMLSACNTLVADGMVVNTTSDRVKSQRAGTLEFILLNHPLDCPVCDKGGECELQDRVFQHSNAKSRMTEPKIHTVDYDLGPLVVRNQDRCIICKRCIKVMEEIAGEPVLEFGQRGVTTEVYTFEHEKFKPGFSGNTIRVCPVGALMSKPFRFKARPWELQKTPSVCSLCSVGCNLREDVRENKLLRVVGLENPQVNDAWLCDRGQFGYDYINSPKRLSAPMVRGASGQLEETSWDAALNLIVEKLKAVKDAGGAAFGAIGSERVSNEDCFVLQQFTREVIGSPNVDHRLGSTRTGYREFRPNPGAIQALPKSDVVLLLATDLTADAPVLDLVLKRSLLVGKMKLIVANPRKTALNQFAAQWLRYRPGAEVALVAALTAALAEEGSPEAGKVGQLATDAGATEADVRAAAKLLAGAKLGSILYGQQVADSAAGGALLPALKQFATKSGHAEKPGHVLLEAVHNSNTWGARDMGVLPDSLPGGVAATQRGLNTAEMLQAAASGKISVLFVQGTNLAVEYPEGETARKALDQVPFLVVSDMFLTETAALADVVLPTVSVAERNCTLTNVEGRVQRTVRAMDPRGAAKPDWAILSLLAEDLGQPLGYDSEADVVKAMRRTLDAATGNAAPASAIVAPAPVALTTERPLRLFTGKLMFDRSTIQRESVVLPTLAPEAFVELHPAEAGRLSLADGDLAVVETALGRVELPVRVSDDTPEGAAFVPSGYVDPPVAGLWPVGATVAACRVSRAEA